MGRFVAAQNTAHLSLARTSHGKWTWSDVTCESGQGFAKSKGCQTPSWRISSQELKSQPKKELIVSGRVANQRGLVRRDQAGGHEILSAW